MGASFKGEKSKCYICGEQLHKKDKIFLLQKADVEYEYKNDYNDDINIDIYKNGSFRILAHQSCQNKMLWKMYYPDLELKEEYYSYLTIGYKDNKKVWRLGSRLVKDNSLQKDIDELLALFAKDLLEGK